MADKEKRRASNRAHYLRHREERLAWARAYRQAFPGKFERSNREARYKLRYGISIREYDEMLVAQGGGCALCHTERAGGRGRFHVDHDHSTGLVRGLLCHHCNTRLSIVESGEYLRMLNYLAGHRKKAA